MLYHGPLKQVKEQAHGQRTLKLRTLSETTLIEAALKTYAGVTNFQPEAESWQVNFSGPDEALAGLLAHLIEHQVRVIHFSEVADDLESVFMQITTGVGTET
jgi:hypothetical protein